MEQALLDLLRKLESIEADHDGLGDTNVREHMSDDVFRGFLRPCPGFSPSGKYGLSAEANALVGDVLRRFCGAATAAAKREGLQTFHQRFAAFQNADVQTAGGADFEDYFGCRDPDWFDASGNHRQNVPVAKLATPATIKPDRRAYVFDQPGSLDALLEAFNRHGGWSWQAAGDGAEDPYLDLRPESAYEFARDWSGLKRTGLSARQSMASSQTLCSTAYVDSDPPGDDRFLLSIGR